MATTCLVSFSSNFDGFFGRFIKGKQRGGNLKKKKLESIEKWVIRIGLLCSIFFIVSLSGSYAYMYSLGGVGGKYDPIFNKISLDTKDIKNSSDVSILEHRFSHEMCHVVWFKILSEEERKKYGAITKEEGDAISQYAKTSLEEDFAEHCAGWILGLDDIITPKRLKFLYDYLSGITHRYSEGGEE